MKLHLVLAIALSSFPLAQVVSAQQPAAQAGAPTRIDRGTGTWTAAGSPYHVAKDLVVHDLTIGPGVKVVAAPGVEIVVVGRLVAAGTAAEPIVFTSEPRAHWDGLRFDHAPDGSSLSYCRIERSVSSGVHLQDSVVALTGCEIVDNYGSSSFDYGGGLRIEFQLPGAGDVELRDCFVARNTCDAYGGGMYVRLHGNRLVLDGCRIESNLVDGTSSGYGATGGGLYAFGSASSEVEMTDCAVDLNRAMGNTGYLGKFEDGFAEGGGVAVANTGLTMVRCSVRDNQAAATGKTLVLFSVADAHGGGLYCRGSSGTPSVALSNCLFAGNIAFASASTTLVHPLGGAIDFDGVQASVTNCTLARNRAVGTTGPLPEFVPGIYASGGSLEIQSSILSANLRCLGASPTACLSPVNGPQIAGGGTLSVAYSDVQGGWPGTGNFSSEALFVGPGTSYADLSLQAGSPCIDAGDPDPAFDDVSFPPSQGGVRNDEGMNGGPLAGGWIGSPAR